MWRKKEISWYGKDWVQFASDDKDGTGNEQRQTHHGSSEDYCIPLDLRRALRPYPLRNKLNTPSDRSYYKACTRL